MVSPELGAISPYVGEFMSKVNRWRAFSATKTVAPPERSLEADWPPRTGGKLTASQIFGSETLGDEQAILAAESEGLAIQED